MSRPTIIRFAIEVPRFPADVVDFGGVVWDLELQAAARSTRAAWVGAGGSEAEAREIADAGITDCVNRLSDRGQA